MAGTADQEPPVTMDDTGIVDSKDQKAILVMAASTHPASGEMMENMAETVLLASGDAVGHREKRA